MPPLTWMMKRRDCMASIVQELTAINRDHFAVDPRFEHVDFGRCARNLWMSLGSLGAPVEPDQY